MAYGMGMVAGAGELISALAGSGAKGTSLKQTILDPIESGQDLFLKQGEKLPQVKQTLDIADDISNRQFQERMAKYAPNYLATNQQIGQNAADLLEGKIPLGGAYNQGYNGRGLTLQDFQGEGNIGMTADDLMNQGAGMARGSMEGARAWDPFHHNVTDTLLTPGALLSREDAHKYQLTDLLNQQRLIRAKGAGITPWMSAIAAGTSNLMSGMGMGGGGGGGGMGGMMGMMGGMGGGGGGGDAAGAAAGAAGGFG